MFYKIHSKKHILEDILYVLKSLFRKLYFKKLVRNVFRAL